MSEEKHVENDPERTLMTLDQLSQTIEVMTNVVNRLRQHLSDQLTQQREDAIEAQSIAHIEEQQKYLESDEPAKNEPAQADGAKPPTEKTKKRSFVVEINQQDGGLVSKSRKTLH